MREKYIVENHDFPGAERLVFGIRYDHKKEELFVGCPVKYHEKLSMILESYFGIEKVFSVSFRKVSWLVDLDLSVWLRGLRELKKSMLVVKVTKFDRLTR